MSEATDHEEEITSVIDRDSLVDIEPVRPQRRRRMRGRIVLAAVVALIAGVTVAWVVVGHRSTTGNAVPGADVVHTTSAPPASGSATVPPPFPDKLTAVYTHNVVQLAWQPATAAHPITQYVVFRDGRKVGTVDNATTWQDSTTTGGQTYAYQVQAVDNTGVGSPLSPKVSVAVPATPSSSAAGVAPQVQAGLPPMPGSWPSASNTGASGALTTVNGDVTLSTTGQVYANMRVKGTLTVTACNVTIRNVEVDSGEPFTGDNTPDLFAIWLQQSAACGTTIDHVSTITSSDPNVYVTTSIRDARGGPVTITNSKLIGAQLGILGMSSGTIRGNYIELGQNMRGDHNDAIQGDGASNLTIDHNTLLNPNDQTSALALYTEYGNNTNIMVSNNLMAGGGFTCYCGDGATQNDGTPARAVNVSFVNNVFWRKYYPDAGHFGSGRAYNPAGGGRWVNNVYMNADGTLTGEQVEQPPIDGA